MSQGSGSITEESGTWTYPPGRQEVGAIQFAYQVSDGELIGQGSASLTIIYQSNVSVASLEGVKVYGSFRDALTRNYIGGLQVTLKVNGSEHTAITSPSSGSVSFSNVPTDSEYFVSIKDPNGVYAPDFFSNVTPDFSNDVDGNPIVEPLNQLIKVTDLYKGIVTTITVKDISGGTPIEGLSLYYDVTAIAESNGAMVSIEGTDIVASETSGVYSFLLPDNDQEFDINVQQLVDSQGNSYQPFRGELVNDLLTTVTPGSNLSYYVSSLSNTEFTIVYHLVDEEGHAYDAGSILVVR